MCRGGGILLFSIAVVKHFNCFKCSLMVSSITKDQDFITFDV